MHKKLLALALCLVALCSVSCMPPQADTAVEVSAPGPALTIVCSMPHIYCLTANVATTRKNISLCMLHPRWEKGALSYSPEDREKATRASVLIINGLGLDDSLAEEAKKGNDKLTIITCSAGITPCTGQQEKANPYVWMSPQSAITQVRTLSESLIALDEKGKKEIERKTGEYVQTLEKIQKSYQEAGAALKDRKALAEDDCLAYVTRDAGGPLTAGVSEDRLADRSKIPQIIKEEGAAALFMVQQRGGTLTGEGVYYLDISFSRTSYPDSYEKGLRSNLAILQKALK